MPRSHKEVEILILKLEQSMRDAKIWSFSSPPTKAFESILPFSVDVLRFEQWLQFIFIPKMMRLVSSKSRMPENLVLFPMAEQQLLASKKCSEVIEVIKQIDLIFAA